MQGDLVLYQPVNVSGFIASTKNDCSSQDTTDRPFQRPTYAPAKCFVVRANSTSTTSLSKHHRESQIKMNHQKVIDRC